MAKPPATKQSTDLVLTAAEKAMIEGDLSSLSKDERLGYYAKVCETVGLNPVTQPFSYIVLNGKLKLYPNTACTDQLRSSRGISIEIAERIHDKDTGLYIVRARARDRSGRSDERIGAVAIPGTAKGEALANAMMKAESKAARRVTLAICGLSFLEQGQGTEMDTPEEGPETDSQPPEPAKALPGVEEAEVVVGGDSGSEADDIPPAEGEAPGFFDGMDDDAERPISEAERKALWERAKQAWPGERNAKFYLKEMLGKHGYEGTDGVTLGAFRTMMAEMDGVDA